MPPSKAQAAKRRRLTLAQLAAYDDVLTDALVDHVFYWTSVPKNRSSYHPSRGIREQVIAGIIQQEVVVNRNLEAAERKLLATDGLGRFHNSLKTDQERDDFRRHLLRYLQIYLVDCPWEVGSTNRYTIVTHEACVTARRPIRRNETVRYLSGIQVNMTPEEERDIAVRKKDFSIVVSSRKKCTSLFMGPARFANHDCGANARLMTTGHAGIEIIATRDIEPGEEITVSLGGRLAAAEVATSRGSSVSGSASSINGDAMETDFTSPDKETPEPSADKPAETDAPRTTKSEESDATQVGALANVDSGSPQFDFELQSPPLSQEREMSASSEAAVAPATVPAAVVPHPPPNKAAAPVVVVSSIETVSQGQEAQPTGTVRRRKYQRRVFIKQTTPPARMRTPGDYVLTPLLLSEPEMAWIQCSNCVCYFVQQNAYVTRSSCPRCERHSKLYGYLWPKTDKASSSDKEERVLDHRTVHRFLDSHQERRARSRKSFGGNGTGDVEAESKAPRGRKPATSAKQAAVKGRETTTEGEPRRSGRARRTSSKVAE
ncbi:histone-lysine N-methyltransferase SET9 [Ophiocordyceps sinensis CO18]|uniref:Histone-lysine N-methyltransferase SET9 n=1 Tax=Ophiocordyceps sinensis (strain Co18 / CGMCC 3.14243) TaxID=911162 RepID=T5AAF4_OPHSC|nr:histone-lysine N-methyltransferase SET9 [Ophiocordyceps sinensis CO18]